MTHAYTVDKGSFEHTVRIVMSCHTYQQLLACEFYVSRWTRTYRPSDWKHRYLMDLIHGRQLTLIHSSGLEQAVEYSHDTVEHQTRIRELGL